MTTPFDKLTWNSANGCWQGYVLFAGWRLPTLIDFDIQAPDDRQRDAAVPATTSLLERMTSDWEVACRQSAAAELIEAVYCQSDEEASEGEADDLAAEMDLIELDFTYCPDADQTMGSCVYRAAKSFPDMELVVNFLNDLSIDEVMLSD